MILTYVLEGDAWEFLLDFGSDLLLVDDVTIARAPDS